MTHKVVVKIGFGVEWTPAAIRDAVVDHAAANSVSEQVGRIVGDLAELGDAAGEIVSEEVPLRVGHEMRDFC